MRNDIHAPSSPSFDPAAYVLLGVFDTAPESGEGRNRVAAIARQTEQGHLFAAHVGQRHVCGHCGHALRYVALMLQQEAGELIYVGEDCLDNRFSDLTAGEFQQLRTEAKLNRERVAKAHKIQGYLDTFTGLAEIKAAIEAGTVSNGFVLDVMSKLFAYGDLSERQINAVTGAYQRDIERAAAADARKAVEVAAQAAGTVEPCPTGRMVITGEIYSVKEQEGYMGGVEFKFGVRDDRGFKTWGSIPAFLGDVERGQRVSFKATIKPSDRDAYFGFATRPVEAK